MNLSSESSRKFCFISCSNQNSLAEYFDLSRFDNNLDFSFENFNLTELKAFNPNIIVIDQYFCENDCSEIIQHLKINFKTANIYFLSPEYANHKGIVQPLKDKNHYYSNFSIDIRNHINTFSENEYLAAS